MTPEEFEPIIRAAMLRVKAQGCIFERELTTYESGGVKKCCALGAFYFDDPARFAEALDGDFEAEDLGEQVGLTKWQAVDIIGGFDSYLRPDSIDYEGANPWFWLGVRLAYEFCESVEKPSDFLEEIEAMRSTGADDDSR